MFRYKSLRAEGNIAEKNGKGNDLYYLDKRTDPLHTVSKMFPQNKLIAAAEHTSYNSAFNETTVISCTEVVIDLIITGNAKGANSLLLAHFPIACHHSETQCTQVAHRCNATVDRTSVLGHRMTVAYTGNTNLPTCSITGGHLIHTSTCSQLGPISVYSMLTMVH